MEWQGPGLPEGNSGDTVRCITAGMGSSVQWNQDQGTLELGRVGNAHFISALCSQSRYARLTRAMCQVKPVTCRVKQVKQVLSKLVQFDVLSGMSGRRSVCPMLSRMSICL